MIKDAVLNFDGRDAHVLRDAARSVTQTDAEALMGWASAGGRPAEAATWIIKHRVETDRIEWFEAERLVSVGIRATDWPVILHLLQLAQHWPEMANVALGRVHLHNAKPMVRTWALDTFVRGCLAGQESLEHARVEVARVLDLGKPSEKARARALETLL